MIDWQRRGYKLGAVTENLVKKASVETAQRLFILRARIPEVEFRDSQFAAIWGYD